MRKLPILLAVLAFAGASLPLGSALRAAPEPAVVPNAWELTAKFDAPQRIFVDGKPYWYVHYLVINNTNQDQLFTPEFELVSDTGQIVAGNKNIPGKVFTQIKALYGNLLLSPLQVLGKILQGEDNAKEGVAMFGGIDADSREFTVYASGFSGETAEVTNPVTQKSVILHKAFQLVYEVPGQAIGIDPKVTFKARSAVMR